MIPKVVDMLHLSPKEPLSNFILHLQLFCCTAASAKRRSTTVLTV